MSETPGSLPLPPELSPRRGGGSGPAVIASRTSGVKRFGRALSWVAAATSLLVLLGSGAGYVYVNAKFSSIKSIGGLCLKGCKDNPTELGATENFLLVGSDTRSGANSTGANIGLAENGAGVGAQYGNSDTTLLVHISADTQKVVVISFPRDMLVQLPTYYNKDGSKGEFSGTAEKFNAAYSVGGPQLLISQVKALTNLPVDHYLSIDFAGFQSMVNALGGITVCLSVPANDPGAAGTGGSGFHATAGTHHLNGTQALMYVRQRDGLPGGDLGRIGRQQRFIGDLINKAKSPSTLTNPLKLNAFIDAVVSNVTKDSGTTLDDLTGLVQKLKNLSPSHVEFLTVPTDGNKYSPQLGDYLAIDDAKAHTLFQEIYNDQDPANPPKPKPTATSAPAATSTLTVPPSDISLAVENGSGITGKAAATATQLRNLGYSVSGISTDTRSDPTSTVIEYGPDKADSAKTLAAAIPGSVLTPSTDGTDGLTLIIGTDFTTVNAVTVGSAVTPTTAAPATTAPTATPSASAAAPVSTVTGDNCGP